MSVLSTPLVADAVARLVAVAINPAAKKAVRFPEIPGHTAKMSIPTRYGPVSATVYRPAEGSRGRPVYVNVHGGGFVVGHPEQDDPWCRYLAANVGVVVVNPDYLLAPKHRFPVAPQQIYDVVCWAAAPDRDWDGSRLCVGGQSAGGNLSAAAARLALEHGTPRIALQVLHYAPLDLVTPTRDKPSSIGSRAVLKPWMGELFDTAYVPDPGERRDRLASPAWAGNADEIAGIAPALIVTAEQDRLREEGLRYAEKLDASGALVEYFEVAGVDHGYNIMTSATNVTAGAYAHIAGRIRDAVAEPN
ncbi:alpha/beta hydrolase [Mycobacterium vicinigordonae]|uniref:Alpha/beta hydrolase n=1 Tax=Mycobacterium vicinigordonae TaxID=1719132 RepID=A0A7D6EA48_9MYCO|nr:alpha/beta hydrolase [Mycobacterium vicinigordonae]QLL08425.1 alpha/beta hydrolase [Mycobacterium vicinigordonae]